MPDAAQAVPFWTSVANTFKGNDAVVFDLFNEPFPEQADSTNETEGWQCWLNGGSSCVGLSYTAPGMQSLVNAVRGTGANNVLMLGGLEWSNDLTQWLSHADRPGPRPGRVLALLQLQRVQQPVLLDVSGGPGRRVGPGDRRRDRRERLRRRLHHPAHDMDGVDGISFLAWAWNADFACSSGPGLVTDYTGTPTAYGAAYKSVLQALPAG